MKSCPTCDTENPDEAHTCSACGSALDQFALDQEITHATLEAKKRTLHKKEIWIGAGVLVVAVIAYNAFFGGASVSRKEAEAFYIAFIAVDEKEYRAFWKCVTRNQGRAANVMQDNLELYRSLESAYNKAPQQYPDFVLNTCMPRIKAFPERMKEIKSVAALEPELGKYIATVDVVAKAAETYANSLDAIHKQSKIDGKVAELGNSFHGDEKASAPTHAYDHFLRCAIPDYDNKADLQGIIEYLASIRKDPVVPVAKWRKDCIPLLTQTEGVKPHANYKAMEKKLVPPGGDYDDRELQAFSSLFEKADRASREALMEGMGKAWMEYFNGWQGLKGKLGEVLGSK